MAKKAALQSEISTILRAFYCELCDKQFKNVAQYDEHTNSYAHHHKARFRDMQLASRVSTGSKEEIDKRKEKERKREEKELRKIAKAAGIKMAKPPVAMNPTSTPVGVEGSNGLKKSGWATVGSAPLTPAPAPAPTPSHSGPSAIGVKTSGWATVAPNQSSSCSDQSPQPPRSHDLAPSSGNNSQYHPGPAPAFRTGGWATLDTGSSQSTPSDPPDVSMDPPPAPRQGGWATVQPSSLQPQSSSSSWSSVSTPPSWSDPSEVASTPTPSQPQPPARLSKQEVIVKQENQRSGWQQFRAGAPGRRR